VSICVNLRLTERKNIRQRVEVILLTDTLKVCIETYNLRGVPHVSETLLKTGHADEVLTLGRELVRTGTRQVEESHDEGETAMEIADCMPVIVGALDRSSLDAAEKLIWALDAVLEDQFEVCEAFAEYLHRRHPKSAWHTLADRLLARLNGLKTTKGR